MKVTYLYHSGFAVEDESAVYIFDYYKGKLPEIDAAKPMYVFASHRHKDHFNPVIFEWENVHSKIQYILSNDIEAVPASNRFFLAPGQKVRIGQIKVTTLCSTDERVAFLVECGDRLIYHAGDLNWWHWEEESIDYNRKMRKNYQKEIKKLSGKKIEIAFVVLDPRQGGAAFSGMDYFMRNVRATHVFPMHMWRDYGLIDRLITSEISAGYRKRIHRIREEGQTIEIADKEGENRCL